MADHTPHELIYAYSIGALPVSVSSTEKALLEMVMGNKQQTAAFREQIVMRALSYNHNTNLHGIDGHDPRRNIPVECKAEQADTASTTTRALNAQLNGEATFGSTLRYDEIDTKFNDLFYIAHGFFWDGKLLAIFEFPSTHRPVIDSIKQYAFERDENEKKGAVKYTAGCWLDATPAVTKCRWINHDLCNAAFTAGILKATKIVGKSIQGWSQLLTKSFGNTSYSCKRIDYADQNDSLILSLH